MGAALALGGCTPGPGTVLRIGAQPWPGYELLHLGAQLGHLNPQQVRLLDAPSASASIRALSAGVLEGACLTLDEVLTARARGIDLAVVAVLDISDGADALVARPGITRLSELVDLTIGAEPSATGAVMLEAVLQAAQLPAHRIRLVHLTVDAQEDALRRGQVDAVVTYEPVKHRLVEAGARVLFSSSQIPGRIIDTLAVHHHVLEGHTPAVRALVAAHFQGLQAWQHAPAAHAATLAQRLEVPVTALERLYEGLRLPSRALNRHWLAGSPPRLQHTAQTLGALMAKARLLPNAPDLTHLVSAVGVSP